MISFRDVTFGYPGGPPIFSDLQLRLAQGKTTALVGPSGSGKTTLLKLACGLLAPTGGRIFIDETEVQLGAIRGVVFHEDTLLPWLTAIENVTLAPSKSTAIYSRASALLVEFGIRSENRATLVASIARGRRWLNELIADPATNAESIAGRHGCTARQVNMMISLAFLAPDLVKAAIQGKLPHGMGVRRLRDMPPEWHRQRQTLGL